MMSMTALEKLAEALFPGPLKTPEEYEALAKRVGAVREVLA